MAKLKSYDNIDTSQDAASGQYYMGELPPAGPYRAKVKFIKVKVNKNQDDMLNVLAEIAEPKGSAKAKYNGYGIWNNINITDQGVPYVKQFLDALGADSEAFFSGKGTQSTETPPQIMTIGKFKLTGENPIMVATKRTEYNGNERLEVTKWAPVDADDDDDDVDDTDVEYIDDEDTAGDVDDDDTADEDAADDDDDDTGDDDDVDDEGAYTREELEEMTLADLRQIAKDSEWERADYIKLSKDDLVTALLGEDIDDDDAADDDGDDEAPF